MVLSLILPLISAKNRGKYRELVSTVVLHNIAVSGDFLSCKSFLVVGVKSAGLLVSSAYIRLSVLVFNLTEGYYSIDGSEEIIYLVPMLHISTVISHLTLK